ncbi:MAG: sterol desaturase family protein [bacterium]
MSVAVAVAITIGMVMSAFTMGAVVWGFYSPISANIRIREEKARKLKGWPVALRIGLNGLFSSGLVYLLALALQHQLFYAARPSLARLAFESVAVLVVYDFLYYLLHRYPFHAWPGLREVHAVHHRAKYPIAFDSLYLNPIETLAGLALLTFCTWLVGPVSVHAFGLIFLVYSQMNILVHCGLDLPGALRPFGFMARKHDAHHRHMKAGNFASLTPIWDRLFRTAE